MGKAAMIRNVYQKNKLVSLSYDNPPAFLEQWDMCLESWLIEVRKLGARWRKYQGTKKCAFEILDNAHNLLACCKPKAAANNEKQTDNELSYACCLAVAEVCLWALLNL